jgi:hypothetical protein
MSVATTDIQTPYREGKEVSIPVAAGVKINTGTLICVDGDGLAVEGHTALGLIAIGRSENGVDNTGGADGDVLVQVTRGRQFFWDNSTADPVTQASFGLDCYIVDNNTVAATDGTGTRSKAGRVLGLESTGVWVEMI